MRNGAVVAEFEKAFASYVGAKFAIALCNGTATLHTALVALGVRPGDRVAVPPLTMSSTTLAVLHAGAVPVFRDVGPDTWVLGYAPAPEYLMSVSLYGLHSPTCDINDAAQTLRPHDARTSFTSYSFQASKILSTGEGGMLVTNDEELATRAREFSSLGYRMRADQPRIDPSVLKASTYERHHSVGYNYRMNDVTAAEGLRQIEKQFGQREVEFHLAARRLAAHDYRDVIQGCDWLTPQHVPEGWTHDYWTYAVACDTPARANALSDSIVTHGGERPYGCWRLAYDEPALQHLNPPDVFVTDTGSFDLHRHRYLCPVAESLQPRILQMQTNNLASAERNAVALRRAIEELN